MRNSKNYSTAITDDNILRYGLVVIPWPVRPLSPNGGEVIPAGSTHLIQWKAPTQAASFKLKYSIDNGVTWLPIAEGLSDTREYVWQVPPQIENQNNYLVKVAAAWATSPLWART